MVDVFHKMHTIAFLLAMTICAAAQNGPRSVTAGKLVLWETINDGADFAIAVPVGYESFSDGGYFIPPSIDITKRVSVTRLINGVFLMVELYQGDIKDIRKDQIARITKADASFVKADEKVIGSTEMQEYRSARNGHTRVERFYLTKKKLYVVQAISSVENDPVVTAFLSSVRIGKDDEARKLPSPVSEIASRLDETLISEKPDREIVIISKPRPGYTTEARNSGVTGEVVLKALFSATGSVTKAEPKSGPKELWGSSIEAAGRIKFLPAEKDGKLVSVWKDITYTFSIY
jgi:hypothetical protein